MTFNEEPMDLDMAVGYFVLKFNKKITLLAANDSFYSLFGLTKEKDGQKTFSAFQNMIGEEEKERLIAEISENIERNKRNFELTMSMERGKGNVKTYVSKCHMDKESGKMTGLVIDITETHEHKMGLQREAIEETKETFLKLACRDELSGLLNRRGIIKEFTNTMEKQSEKSHGFLLVDIDDFKRINEEHGHVYGDEVLTNFAFNIMSSASRDNVAGRLGGDEFVVLLKDIDSKKEVEKQASDLLFKLATPIKGDRELTASIGISIYPDDGKDFSELYKKADKALFKAKGEGKNRYVFYSDDIDDHPYLNKSLETVDRTDDMDLILSKKMMKALVDTAPGGIGIYEYVNKKIITRYINDEFLNIMGISRANYEMLYGDDFRKTIDDESWKALDEASDKTRADLDGPPAECEFKLSFSLTEEPVWLFGRIKYIPYIGGRVLFLVMSQDISKQKEAAEFSLGMEKTYLRALKKAGISTWTYDFNEKVLVNQEGKVFHEIEEMFESGYVHKDVSDTLFKIYNELKMGAPEGEAIIRGKVFGRTYEWFKVSFKTVFAEDKRPLWALGIIEQLPLGYGSKNRFALEEWVLTHLGEKGMKCVKCNLSGNRIDKCKNFMLCKNQVTYDSFRESLKAVIYDEKDSGFYDETERLRLMDSFASGIDHKRYVILVSESGGKLNWVTAFVRLVMHPETGDIYCYMYLKDDDLRIKRELEVQEPIDRDFITTLYTEEFMRKFLKKTQGKDSSSRGILIVDLLNVSYEKISLGEGRMAELLSRWGQDLRLLLPSKYLACVKQGSRFLIAVKSKSDSEFVKEIKEVFDVFKTLVRFKDPEGNFSFAGGAALSEAEGTYQDTYERALEATEKSAGEGNWKLNFYETEGERRAVVFATGGEEIPEILKGQIEMEGVVLEEGKSSGSIDDEFEEQDDGVKSRLDYLNRVEALRRESLKSLGVLAVGINILPNIGALKSIREIDEVFKEIVRLIAEELKGGEIFRVIDSEIVAIFMDYQEEYFLTVSRALETVLKGKFPGRTSIGYCWAGDSVDVNKLLVHCQELKRVNHLKYRESVLHRTGEYHDTLLSNLVEDLEKEKYQAFYQPVISLENNKVWGMEALARGINEKGDIVLPSMFVANFEEIGIIRYLDIHILEESLKALKRFNKEGFTDLRVSVNYSRETMLERGIVEKTLNLIDKYGVDRKDIQIEITERMGDLEESTIARVAGEFKESGLFIALDDFGYEYSNFSIFSKLDVAIVKIDRSLIEQIGRNRNSEIIIKAIIDMCKEMNITSLGEGVSTLRQLKFLREIGCQLAQGFYFGKALEREKFRERYLLGNE